jgi:hypothetical protein
MAFLRRVAFNETTTNQGILIDSIKRAWRDSWNDWGTWSIDLPFKILIDFPAALLMNSNRYPLSYDTGSGLNQTQGTQETASKSHLLEFSRLCIQSLAFQDWQPFADLCRGVKLDSPYILQTTNGANPDIDQKAIETYNRILTADYDRLLTQHISMDLLTWNKPKMLPYKRGPLPEGWQTFSAEDKQLAFSKNQDQRICGLRNYHRNNYIVWLTQQLQSE